MNRKIIGLLSLFIIILTMSVVCAEENQTSANLTSSNIVVSGDSFDDVQDAIKGASSNDVIELEGYYHGNRNPIKIDKSVTIQGSGNGATLDAKKMSSVFDIKANNVTLKDLTIKNSYGSAILNEFNNKKFDLTIINCSFINNNEQDDGGAIFHANNGALTIINSTFEKNEADYGGAVYVSSGNLKIINSNFKSNVATYHGGAIYAPCDTISISGCQFNANRASKGSEGGAISSLCNNALISDSSFQNNRADNGGAINCWGNLTVKNSSFTSNVANEKAGAIFASSDLDDNGNFDSRLSITDSNFTSNTAANVSGIYTKLCTVDISNSQFSDNQEVYIKLGTLKNVNNTLKNVKIDNTLKMIILPDKYSTTYDSLECLRVSALDDERYYISNVKIKVVVTVGKKTKTFYGYTDLDEYEAYIPLYQLPVGKYSIKVSVESNTFKSDTVKKTVTIKKADTIVKAPKLTAKYKKSKKFTITVKNKKTLYKVKNLKLKVKVYTGKKVKKYIVKTNKKGIATINTKNLKRGSHKVVITSKNKNYDVYKKSTIVIK